jgi:3-hydroxybutyryl-CoA dehydrogenase
LEIAKVGVLGCGLMGHGIAQICAQAGWKVVVREVSQKELDAGIGRIEKQLGRAVEKGKMEEADAEAVRGRIQGTLDYADLAESDLVIEAITEDLEAKLQMWSEVDGIAKDGAFFATNTSSLPVAEQAAATSRPERFLGLHFFNPVPASKLVEVVVAPQSAPEVVEAARGWVQALGKTDVVVKDSPGFASSRLGVLLGLEAIRMLEEGVADAEAIDAAMELGYRHPMGPLRSTDLVGLDVRLAIAEYLASTLGDRFSPPQLLRDKVAAGELGRKTGRGFHDYTGV